MSECNTIDERGARLNIKIPTDKVFSRTFTFVDNAGADIDMTAYTDIILRVNTTVPTVYSELLGDITVANVNEVIFDFECEIAVGDYTYTINLVTSVGEEQIFYGTFKVV